MTTDDRERVKELFATNAWKIYAKHRHEVAESLLMQADQTGIVPEDRAWLLAKAIGILHAVDEKVF